MKKKKKRQKVEKTVSYKTFPDTTVSHDTLIITIMIIIIIMIMIII